MRSDGIIRVFVLLLISALLLAFTACGQGSAGKRAVVQGLSPGSSAGDKTSPEGLDYRADETLDGALGELEELECPEGVDAELWGELKGALEEALTCRAATCGPPLGDCAKMVDGGAQVPALQKTPPGEEPGWLARPTHGGKFVSTPPTGDNNRVNDLSLDDHYDTTYTLTWSYRNSGDYDQNGTVSISDITPIAIHYGEEVPEGDDERNSIQAVVDGSENDKVDISDITPIAMYYGTCCAAYSIRAALSHPESIEDTTEIDTAPIELAEGDERKTFSVELVLSPRTYIAVAPMDADETPGELSSVVLVPNHPPVAELVVDPEEGQVPLDVSFNASGSSDIDGPIAKYEWDWEGDGVYDHDSGSVPTAEHTYDIAQTYAPQVRVTDEHNGTDTTSVEVWAGEWRIFTAVDETGGIFTNLEVVNGHPAISYRAGYVRANDPLGTTWGEPVVVGSQGSAQCNSMAVVNGRPAIAYYDWEDNELLYVRANDANGDSWGEPLIVAYADIWEWGDILSLVVVNGNPAIAYGGAMLLYIRANDPNGESWGSPILVTGIFGQLVCSMAEVSGRPAISYYDIGDNFILKYVRAGDAEGNTWGSPVVLECMAAERSSLAVIKGYPAISYTGYEGDTPVLKYVRALDPNGNAWGTPLILDNELPGGWPSLATINGRPAISYGVCSGDTSILRYVQAVDPDGASWHSPMTVQLPGSDEGGAICMSMANVNGHPAISYGFNDPVHGVNQLRYAVYY